MKKWQVPLSVKTYIQVGQPPFHFLSHITEKIANQADKGEKSSFLFLDEKFELAISGGGKEIDRAGKYIIFERGLFTPNCRSFYSDKN